MRKLLLLFCVFSASHILLIAQTAPRKPVRKAPPAAAANQKETQEVLTNASIIKMVKAGFSEDIILKKIRSTKNKFALDADGLVALKTAGVDDRIISAMMGGSEVTPSSEAKSSKPALPPPVKDPEKPNLPPSTLVLKNAVSGQQSLKDVHNIFIEKMDNDLDQYLRAEIAKQFKGKVQVVLDRPAADGILVGVSEEQKGTGAKITGRYLGLHDVATGTISLLDKEGKTILWSNEAGDRSLIWGMMARGGQRKVADRLISKLKKAMDSSK